MTKILCMAFLASAAVMTAVKAEPLPTTVIGIVEQATLDKSAAFKSILDQLEKKRKEIQNEMTSYDNELKAQDKKLAEEQKTLSEKDYAQKRQAFEKRVRDIHEKVEIRKAQIEIALEAAKTKVYETFLKVAEEVKKESGASVILYKETVVTADPSFDLTPKVLEKLNQALPTVPVSFKSEEEIKKQLQQLQQQPQQS